MASGLYGNIEIIERFSATVAAGSLNGFAQPFVVPCDLELVGLIANCGTAPATTAGVIINLQVTPTSQMTAATTYGYTVPTGAANQSVAAYNAWTAANAPSILGALKTSTSYSAPAVVQNVAYAQNYPFPGAAGTVGYTTAQKTTTTTLAPVAYPPSLYAYQAKTLVNPDNTYTDLNGQTQPANLVRAGDIIFVTIAAGGTGASIGSAANLSITILANKN